MHGATIMGNMDTTDVRNTTHPLKVLVIETDPAMLFLFQQILIMTGFEVLSARFGQEGQRIACREQPDAILTNIFLPDIGGFTLLQQLKANPQTSTIPALATTAHWTDFGERYFISRGFHALIKQPIDLGGIGAVIREAIAASQYPEIPGQGPSSRSSGARHFR